MSESSLQFFFPTVLQALALGRNKKRIHSPISTLLRFEIRSTKAKFVYVYRSSDFWMHVNQNSLRLSVLGEHQSNIGFLLQFAMVVVLEL